MPVLPQTREGESTSQTGVRSHRFVPRTLGTRLALTYAGLTLLIMAALAWSLAGVIRDFYIGQLREDLLQETVLAADLLAPALIPPVTVGEIDAIADRLGADLDARVTVVAADGAVLGDSESDPSRMDNHRTRPEIQEAIARGTGSSVRSSSTVQAPFFYVARSVAPGGEIVRLGIPLEVVEGLVYDIQRQVAVAALVAAVLMTGAGLIVARRIGEALEAMRKQATAVAAGAFDVMVDPAPTRELGDLGRAFNAMTRQLRLTLTELDRVRARLEATLANLSDGVIITDAKGQIVLANEAAISMLAAQGALVNEPFVEAGRDHELVAMMNQALSELPTTTERVIRHGRSGRVLQVAASGLDAAGSRIGVIVMHDITELRQLEGIRREFVANVSHELRTPLTSIRALVETLEAGAIDDPEVSSDFLARIISEVDRLASLVDELLDLARLESGRVRINPEPVAADVALHRAAERLGPQTERAGLRVDVTVAPDTPTVLADRARVDQVLLNLVHNAAKFTPGGGAISLSARLIDDDVEFRVADTGVGVGDDELPRLFERFYKADRARRSEGTGLGLAIAKHIVQAHGGSIWAEPNAPRGTVFVFTLPVAGPARDEPPEAMASVVMAGDSTIA